MTKMSDLPRELTEEVLCRTPMTSLRRVRSSCKKWNTLSKDRSFAKQYLGRQAIVAAAAKEFTLVLIMEFKVYLMSFNLHNTLESFIKPKGKLISLDDSDEVDVSQVFHCDGLLLCIMKDKARLVVWNPYSGHIRRIEPIYKFSILDLYSYALGYDKSSKSRSHKILVFADFLYRPYTSRSVEFKIYDFNSDSWRVLDLTPDWRIDFYRRGISLKGKTYWFATEYVRGRHDDSFLLCFDFTRERFGPRLLLPVEWFHHPTDTVTLSSVREEQLAILYQSCGTQRLEIWITTKIEPNEVSWNRKVFLAMEMRPIYCFGFQFSLATFFVDEEKKVAVVFDKEKDIDNPTPNVAYIVGVDGSLKEVYLGESASKLYFPLVCSYVPGLLQP